MRSRAPPVAYAARRSTRSGRKERASEQREVLFGYRKAEGADAPAATFEAHLCAVRTMFTSFVSSRSLAVRGSWGIAPSVFWYGAPGGTQGPPGKGGAAERWRVTPSVSWVTRHGAQPATTRTYKSRAPAASRTSCHPPVTPPRRRRPQTIPIGQAYSLCLCKRLRDAVRRNKAGHSLCRQSLRFAPLTTSLYTREALGTCVQFMPL